MAYGSTKEQAVARLGSALDKKRTSTLPLSVCLSVPLSLSLFLTLSISFSPHSTSGRADKAKEGKLCIIMSSLFPYSHVSVCASACVCVCVASASRVRVCSWGSYCSHPWGHKSHNKRRRRRKSRPKTLHNFCVFLSFRRKIVAFLVSFPNSFPIPSIHAALWSD